MYFHHQISIGKTYTSTSSSRDGYLLCSVSIAGYISVCVQLYCVGFHCFTTCFGLHGHLQVCRIFYFHMLERFCFAVFSTFFFFTWSHSACFHLWGGLNMRYYYLLFMLFWYCYMCVFLLVFCSCAVFLCDFCCFLACMFVWKNTSK
jgi:hypothetical protein